LDTYAETDVYLNEQTVYRPDLCVYARPRASKSPLRLVTPPDLVVEISSPDNKAFDLITKRDDYERFGVKEYRAIDPDARPDAATSLESPLRTPSDQHRLRVRAWHQENGRFIESLVEGDTLASKAIAGFGLNVVPLRVMTR
ncbi:MAG: Uma2 family endonuclease, partial [Pyrinomonadaceae bacterium]|nr:Uma2 family endonuclease [Phycisphaerales bacterium]